MRAGKCLATANGCALTTGTLTTMRRTGRVGRALEVARVDGKPDVRQPSLAPLVVATVASVAASLGADALLVLAGTSLFPSTTGYSHFRFSDYAVLTVIGVIVACLAWPVVTRITSEPRWLFFRLALAVSGVLLLPDVWLLAQAEPGRAVAVLVVMHLVIALVTYNLLVHLAPVGSVPSGADRLVGTELAAPGTPSRSPKPVVPGRMSRRMRTVWISMICLIGVEFVLGILALISVPTERPNGWLPVQGQDIYLAHAIVGGLLGLAAAVLLLTRARTDRLSLYGALVGLIGIGLGGGGGLLTVDSSGRILGICLMFVGSFVAWIAYAAPLVG